MRIIMIMAFLVFGARAFAQAPQWNDLKLFAANSTASVQAIHIDKDNNFYITGDFFRSSWGNDSLFVNCESVAFRSQSSLNGFVFRFDSTRKLNLSLPIGDGLAGELVVDDESNIIISGGLSYGASRDGLLRKYDRNGNELWSNFVRSTDRGRDSDDIINSVDISKDGSLVVSAFSYGDQVSVFGHLISGPSNFVAKLDVEGSLLWIHHFSSALGRGVYRVKFDHEGDVLFGGNEVDAGNQNKTNGVIGKISGWSGNLLWKRSFAPVGNFVPTFRGVAACENSYVFGGHFGGKMVVTDSTYTSSGGLDIILIKTDVDGNIVWSKKGGSTGRDVLNDLVCGSNSIIYVTGGYSDGFQFGNLSPLSSKGHTDVYVIAVDSLGNPLWERHGGSDIPGHTDDLFYEEAGQALAFDNNGSLNIVGGVRGSGNFGSLYFSAPEEIGRNGFWLSLGTKAASDTVRFPCPAPTDPVSVFDVLVFPNPFAEQLIIDNTEGKAVTYQITLANSRGQIVSRKIMTGSRVVISDWNSFPRGLYFITVQVGNYKQSRKILKDY